LQAKRKKREEEEKRKKMHEASRKMDALAKKLGDRLRRQRSGNSTQLGTLLFKWNYSEAGAN
jgi:hypothetical protein